MKTYCILIIALFSFNGSILGDFCATIDCSTDLGSRVCYQHSGDSPVTNIKMAACKDTTKICDIFQERNMAWVNTTQQYWSIRNRNTTYDYSNVYMQTTMGYCRDALSFQKSLNAGRACQYNHQCNSQICSNNICQGKTQGTECSDHSECDVESACRREWSWPFQTKCRAYAQKDDFCDSDYDCHTNLTCIYESENAVNNGFKKCQTKYSANDGTQFGWQTYGYTIQVEEALRNGQYCKSGWAYQSGNKAICFSISSIQEKYASTTISSPYSCNPSLKTDTFPYDMSLEPNRCKYFYGSTTSSYYTAPCDCAMNGKEEGYCRYPGKSETLQYISIMKQINSNTRCHTLDRDNLYAQYECGIGNSDPDSYQDILNGYFKFNNWPLSQATQPLNCYQKVNPYNLTAIKTYKDAVVNQTLELSVNTQANYGQVIQSHFIFMIILLINIMIIY